MTLRFAGFELDRSRAELRGLDGAAIRLRPKTLNMLIVLTANSGRLLSKQELMEAVWPNVHVGDDSLFQCIREIRTALGDDRRQIIKLVSGRGYLFDAEVSTEAATAPLTTLPAAATQDEAGPTAEPETPIRTFDLRRPLTLAAAGLACVVALAIATVMFTPGILFGRGPVTIAVMPIAVSDNDRDIPATAADVTTRLRDGLAKIENVRVAAPQLEPKESPSPQADFVVTGELQKSARFWEAQVRMTRTATGEVVWAAPVSVTLADTELSLQQSRLAAGIGHLIAQRINVLINSGTRQTAIDRNSTSGTAKVAIEQATASIVQTTRERFAASQTMLEKALASDPENTEIAVALAALQLRGIQMVWYSPTDSAVAESNAKAVLERALRSKPSSIPVLEAYCRFLNATNEFVESLIACARTLSFDPWNGLALYHIGLAQLQLGRFEDALETFKQADSFDTPQVSRWTWRLGVGMAYLFMGRNEDALPWLQSSIAITPASGRPLMLLSAAYQHLGRTAEAKAAIDKALEIRPGSTVANAALPRKNSSAAFLAVVESIGRANAAAGLPAR